MVKQIELPMYDKDRAEMERELGIANAMAYGNREAWVKMARHVAADIASRYGVVTQDDVGRWFARHGVNLSRKLGNATGAIFRDSMFEHTGEWTKSDRVSRHANRIGVWRLSDSI